MNDTELLDRIVEIFERPHRDFDVAVGKDSGLTKKELTELTEWINKERAEEELNRKIKKEVARQLKAQ